MLTKEEKELLGCFPGTIFISSSDPLHWRNKPYAEVYGAMKKMCEDVRLAVGVGKGTPTHVFIGCFREPALNVDFEPDGITCYNARTGNIIGKVWIGEIITDDDAQTLMEWASRVSINHEERCIVCGEWFRDTAIEEPCKFPGGQPGIKIYNKYYHQWSFSRVVCNDCLPEFEKSERGREDYYRDHPEVFEIDRQRLLKEAAKN